MAWSEGAPWSRIHFAWFTVVEKLLRMRQNRILNIQTPYYIPVHSENVSMYETERRVRRAKANTLIKLYYMGETESMKCTTPSLSHKFFNTLLKSKTPYFDNRSPALTTSVHDKCYLHCLSWDLNLQPTQTFLFLRVESWRWVVQLLESQHKKGTLTLILKKVILTIVVIKTGLHMWNYWNKNRNINACYICRCWKVWSVTFTCT